MITRIKNGKVLINEIFCKTDIYIEDKFIKYIGGERAFDNCIDAEGNYVTAGFIDLHCHGGGGADFTDGSVESVRIATNTHLEHGTTSVFPTVLSADSSVIEKAIFAIEEAKIELPSIAGIHIEGPYFSPNQTGAQNAKALRKPTPKEYLGILNKYKIARWDYAPELDDDFSFLDSLLENNVVAAAGHTDATCEQMEAAAERGCRLITHLYSCTSTIRREKGFRIAGVTEAAYLSDDICAELIADGCHLPATLLRLAYKQKGADKLALVTDAMRAAGTDHVGECEIGGVPCYIEDGVAKLLDRSAFAGSIATVDRLVKTAISVGISLEDAIKMVTKTPASIMRLDGKGEISIGNDADIVIFDTDINVKSVILEGKTVI